MRDLAFGYARNKTVSRQAAANRKKPSALPWPSRAPGRSGRTPPGPRNFATDSPITKLNMILQTNAIIIPMRLTSAHGKIRTNRPPSSAGMKKRRTSCRCHNPVRLKMSCWDAGFSPSGKRFCDVASARTHKTSRHGPGLAIIIDIKSNTYDAFVVSWPARRA